jgi:hypothetical protein
MQILFEVIEQIGVLQKTTRLPRLAIIESASLDLRHPTNSFIDKIIKICTSLINHHGHPSIQISSFHHQNSNFIFNNHHIVLANVSK